VIGVVVICYSDDAANMTQTVTFQLPAAQGGGKRDDHDEPAASCTAAAAARSEKTLLRLLSKLPGTKQQQHEGAASSAMSVSGSGPSHQVWLMRQMSQILPAEAHDHLGESQTSVQRECRQLL
jgi:hypothetical protein